MYGSIAKIGWTEFFVWILFNFCCFFTATYHANLCKQNNSYGEECNNKHGTRRPAAILGFKCTNSDAAQKLRGIRGKIQYFANDYQSQNFWRYPTSTQKVEVIIFLKHKTSCLNLGMLRAIFILLFIALVTMVDRAGNNTAQLRITDRFLSLLLKQTYSR